MNRIPCSLGRGMLLMGFLALPLFAQAQEDQILTYKDLRSKLELDYSPLKPMPEMVWSYADVVESASPAVVTIYSEREEDPELEEMMQDPLFKRLFPMPEFPRQDRVTGSGVIITKDGYILTNNHVVEQSKGLEVIVNSMEDQSFEAKLVVSDPKTDVALIKIEGKALPRAIVGSSENLRVGDVTLAIGNPFGLSQTVTHGIVSAKGRGTSQLSHLVDYADFIQTDASINRGNSGGALIDAQGRLVGINTAIQVGGGGGNIGIGFAIPVDMALDIVDRLLEGGGTVKRGFLGVFLQEVDRTLADKLEWKESYGVAIGRVMPDTPADNAGLKEEDVIVSYQGTKARNIDSLRLDISNTPPNREVEFGIFRKGKEIKVTVKLAELPDDPTAMARPEIPEGLMDPETPVEGFLNGVEIVNLTKKVRKDRELAEDATGVLVDKVEEGSPAHEAGLRKGQLIIEVNQQQVNSVEEAEQVLANSEGPFVVVRVIDGEEISTLAVRER